MKYWIVSMALILSSLIGIYDYGVKNGERNARALVQNTL